MSWKGSWGGQQSQWGAEKSGKGGDSWSNSQTPAVVKPPNRQQQESSWNQEPAWKKQATGDSWQIKAKGSDSGAKGGKGGESSWNQEPAWKKQATGDSWQDKAKGSDSGAKGGKGGWQQVQTPQQKAEELKKKLEQEKAKKAAEIQTAIAKKTAELKAKSEKATRDSEMAEKLATPVMEKAKKVMEDEKASLAAGKVSVDGLEKQMAKAKEVADAIQKDFEECKKAGPNGKDYLEALQKAMIKAGGLRNQINIILGKLKPRTEKQQKEQDAKAKAAKEEAERKAKEAKDTASFKPILGKMTKDVAGVEDSVNVVAKKADAIIAKTPEGDELEKATAEVEKAAGEALKKLNTTTTELTEKFKSIVDYAPEAKKASQTALTDLRKKLTDCSKRTTVYTSFKKELPKLVASKAALTEIKEKLDGHDKAILNATKLGDMPTLEKTKIEAIDNQLEPVKTTINEVNILIAKSIKTADAVSASRFTDFKSKGEEQLKKIQAVYSKIRKDRDVIMSDDYIALAGDKLEKAEAGWTSCQDAEMPFLTGVEVLEGEQNDQALKGCEEAIVSSSAAVLEAKAFVQKRLADSKQSEKVILEKMEAALKPILTKIIAVETNLTKFKKEHSDRKILSVLSTAFEAVEAVEKKAVEVDQQGKQLAPSEMEDESVESITETTEKTKAVLAEGTKKFSEAQKLINDKQKEAKAGAGNDKLAKINSRMSAAQEKLSKVRSAIQLAEKVVKAKQAIGTGEEKMKEAEAEVAKVVEKFASSKFTAASVKEFLEACNSALFVIRSAGAAVQPHIGVAPAKAKELLQALLERRNEAQKSIEKIKADTKDDREEVLVNAFLADADKLAKSAEDSAESMEVAEKPFLLGDLKLEASLEAIKKCEETAAMVRKAVLESDKFAGLKAMEGKQFGAAASKKSSEGIAKVTERVKAVSTKLGSFEKELKERTKSARLTEAGVKVDEVEAAFKTTATSAEPFTKEGGADMSEKDAEEPLKVFQDSEKELSKLIVTAKGFLSARTGEQKGNKENTETLKSLQERVSKVQTELLTIKKSTTSHEQRALGTKMLAEATAQVGGLEAEIKKAADACAPMVEKAGEEFLVDTSLRTLVAALVAHLKEKELDVAALFKEVGKGKSVKQKAFVEYLAKLPEAISHDELSAFSDERRAAIFTAVSKDGKSLTAEDFTSMFCQTYTCTKPTTLTDKFASDGAETLCKVEVGSEVVLSGVPKEDETGLVRSEAAVGDAKGWITISQKKGAPFLKLKTKLDGFSQVMDKALAECTAAVNKVNGSVNGKSKAAPGDEAPMKASKEEIAKFKEKVTEAQKALEELRKKVATAKRDFLAKEKSEINAHIEARNMKLAAVYLEGPNAKLETLESAAKAAEDASTVFTALSGDELLAFATPATVLDATEKAFADVSAKATETKEACKDQMKIVSEVSPQTGGTAEAKKRIQSVQSKVAEAVSKVSKCVATAKSHCAKIVEAKMEPAAVAIRAFAQEKKLSGEALFDEFKEGDKITEAGFCKLVQSLGDSALSPDVAKLISQKIGKDGISKDVFLDYVVVYYKTTKAIAFTDILDISTCKTLRRIAVGEILELLEDPQPHEGTGTMRLKAKSLKKPIVEGWVTMKGKEGSVFMEKTKKP